jgi:hypothetical protein
MSPPPRIPLEPLPVHYPMRRPQVRSIIRKVLAGPSTGPPPRPVMVRVYIDLFDYCLTVHFKGNLYKPERDTASAPPHNPDRSWYLRNRPVSG